MHWSACHWKSRWTSWEKWSCKVIRRGERFLKRKGKTTAAKKETSYKDTQMLLIENHRPDQARKTCDKMMVYIEIHEQSCFVRFHTVSLAQNTKDSLADERRKGTVASIIVLQRQSSVYRAHIGELRWMLQWTLSYQKRQSGTANCKSQTWPRWSEEIQNNLRPERTDEDSVKNTLQSR